MLEGYNDTLKNELELAQTKNEGLQHEVEVERDQSARLTTERDALRKHIEDLQQIYSKNREAISAMEGLESETRAGERKGVFVGAYISKELSESLKNKAALGRRTLSQEIIRALRNSILRQTFSAFDPDYLDLSNEAYVHQLELHRFGMNLSQTERMELMSGLSSGTETHESVLRKMEWMKDQKLQNAISQIVAILGGNGSESERIERAKALARHTLFVPTF